MPELQQSVNNLNGNLTDHELLLLQAQSMVQVMQSLSRVEATITSMQSKLESKADKLEVSTYEARLNVIEKELDKIKIEAHRELEMYKDAMTLQIQQRDERNETKAKLLEDENAGKLGKRDDRIEKVEGFQGKLIGIAIGSGFCGSLVVGLILYIVTNK